MRHFRRILIVIALLAVIFATAVVVSISVLPETDLIRVRVQDQLSSLTGQIVKLGPLKVSWSFPRLISLNVQGISITSKEGAKLVSADRLILIPSLAPLLKKEIAVESTTIEGLRVSVRRSQKGTIQGALIPLPSTYAGKPSPKQKNVGPEVTIESDGHPVRSANAKPENHLHLSINEVKLVDGRVDWIDQKISPGTVVERSLKQINGILKKNAADNVVSVNITGRLDRGQPKDHSVRIEGQAALSQDQSNVERIAMNVSSDSLELRPFHIYFPPKPRVALEFDNAAVQAHLSWEKAGPVKLALKTVLKANSYGHSHVNIQGDILFAPDMSAIQSLQGTAETDMLPMALFKTSLPRQLPFHPGSGLARAAIKGDWNAANNWRLQGTLSLENIVPTGVYGGIAKKMSLWAQAKLDPDQLLLDNMEIRGAGKLVSLRGKVARPFSESRSLDLQGEIPLRPEWLKHLGVQLPNALHIRGALPIRWMARGLPRRLWLDASADITSAALEWAPYLEKDSGKKGNISIKGTFFPWKEQKNLEPAIVTIGMIGSRIRLKPQGPWASGLAVRLDSKVLFKSNTADLRDTSLVIRRANEAADMLTAKASIAGVGSGDPAINGTATLAFNSATIALAGLELPAGGTVTGTAPLKAKFTGSPQAMTWSLELPLTYLDVNVEHVFHKQGGVAGSLNAAGKFSHKELDLTNGRLTLPGVMLMGRGVLRDRNGKFQEVSLDMKRADLRNILRYLPGATGVKLSGPAEATIRLIQTEKNVVPTGFVRLLGVNFRQGKVGWSLEKIKGTVETTNGDAEIPELAGTIHGLIEGPLKIKGSVKHFTSLEKLNGRLSLEMGQGRINAGRLKNALKGLRVFVGTLLDPQAAAAKGDLFDFQSILGDVVLKSGTASTDNLRLKGHDLTAGLIGTLRWNPSQLDLLARIQTATVAGNVLRKIPGVQNFIKKHEGLLKVTGLGKELKRFGIDVPDSQETKTPAAQPVKTPVTVILKIHGPAPSPEVTPILETALDKATASRLKSLTN